VSAVEGLSAKVELKKLSPSQFGLEIFLSADVVQACVVTLEPVPSHIERRFARELHFSPPSRRKPEPVESEPVVLADPDEDEPPEEIDSLIYDLARPVLEEYILSLDPYPRSKGAEFGLKTSPGDRPESPFAVLKSLKSRS
jgi:uncharacterized metal-binding protein YceD (DUF177 family)